MSSPKVFLHEAYKKKDGTCAVYVLVHIDNRSIKFPTGITVAPDHFDRVKMRIKGNSQKVKDDNMIIDKSLARINDVEVRYRLQQKELTADLLKKEWKNPARRVDFFAFFNEAIKERKNDIADSTYNQHQSAINKLKEFRPKLAFTEIDSELIEQYRRWLKSTKKNDLNTIYTALKNFKTYVNIAKRKGVIDESPFDSYSIRRSNPERVFLDEVELQSLWKLYLKDYLDETNQRVLRHFLFMCFTGLRISDLKTITTESIIGERWVYFPVKTRSIKKEAVKIPINIWAKKLISDEGSKTGVLFNCISEQKMNVKIKDIVAVVKIAKDVSNHSARHTFATLWLRKTKDVLALQKLLGHSDITQTMIYTHITDGMIAEEMKNFENTLFFNAKNPGSGTRTGETI